ncbi:MAG: hypothetical protein EOL88_02045 [Bacteroidia bacterium]|nr:hypothetical protein [Bacteroidia bacterium]
MQFWLHRSWSKCKGINFDSDLPPDDYDDLEALASRYARACDIVYQKMFRCVDTIEMAPKGSLLDAVHRAEKRGFFESELQARQLRELRNEVVHEYASANLRYLLERIVGASQELLIIMDKAAAYAQRYV